MDRSLLFDSPYLLGFEHTRTLIERAGKAATEGYPPYNVEDIGGGGVRITLAVAGFATGQLDVAIESNHLTVSGKREPEAGSPGERAFIHRGIASRGFVRGFILADGLEVLSARLDHGLLHIDVVRPASVRPVRHIPIQSGG